MCFCMYGELARLQLWESVVILRDKSQTIHTLPLQSSLPLSSVIYSLSQTHIAEREREREREREKEKERESVL